MTEEAAAPKHKEIEILFAQEAAQEAAAETLDEFKPSEAVLGFLTGKYGLNIPTWIYILIIVIMLVNLTLSTYSRQVPAPPGTQEFKVSTC